MFSRISCFLCALIVSNGAGAQPSMRFVECPPEINNQMAQREMQDEVVSVLAILEPKNSSKITGSVVKLKLDLSGDLKGHHDRSGYNSTTCEISVVK